ncbi:MAG: hypothetical protein JW814_09475 [Candidatus Krumholzibacteriota bacterium]|nr:hypothetical protein [Candidatus Krumholzibacteriota bacterium]
MNIQHKDLSAGKWNDMTIPAQMANIGSEVGRAINWRKKGNMEYSLKAAARALELLDLSLDAAVSYPALKEFARVREALVDYFYGSNEYSSSDLLWLKYFDHFNYAARK